MLGSRMVQNVGICASGGTSPPGIFPGASLGCESGPQRRKRSIFKAGEVAGAAACAFYRDSYEFERGSLQGASGEDDLNPGVGDAESFGVISLDRVLYGL